MGANRNDALDAAGIERLLSGRGEGPRPLATLLSAASAPGHPDELGGEEAAIAAFRLADRATDPVFAPRTHRRQPARGRWAGLVTAKVGGVALVLAAGGVALAAATGLLPGVLGGEPHTGTSAAGSGRPQVTDASGTAPDAAGTSSPSGQPSASPSPSLLGLCQAHLAHITTDPDISNDPEFLHNPAFAVLAAAAGGSDEVTSFCAAMVYPPSASPTPEPEGTVGRPTAPPAGRPTGPPTTQPASVPAPVQQEQAQP